MRRISMRCEDLVERHGYYTGRRCGRRAKWLVDGAHVCGIHKNKRLRHRTWGVPHTCEPFTGRKSDEGSS